MTGRGDISLVQRKLTRVAGEASGSTSAMSSDNAKDSTRSPAISQTSSPHVSINIHTNARIELEPLRTFSKESNVPGSSSDDEAQYTSNQAVENSIRSNTMTMPRDDSTYTNFALRRSRSRERSGRNGYVTLSDEGNDDPIVDLPGDYKRLKMSPLSFVEYVILPLVIFALLLSIFIPSLARHVFLGFHLWRWLMLIIVLIFGGVLAIWLTRMIVFLVQHLLFLRTRFLYFIYGVHRSFRSCIWVLLVFLAWVFLFDERMTGETKAHLYITKFFFCLIVAAILRLVKNILLKVLASSFHVNAYFDRIQDALLNQCIIEKLSIPPHHQRPQLDRSKAAKDYTERIDINQLHKLNKNNISSWSMRRLIKIMKYGTLTVLDESPIQILSENGAKLAAKTIFINVAKPGAKNIDCHDLKDFMEAGEVENIMCLLGGTREDGISKSAFKNWVVNAYKGRRALTFALNDAKTIVKRLHQIANVLVGIIVICIWLLLLNIATTHFFVLVGTPIFAATFIFGDTLKKIFESVIFVFTTHPFDVGDHCEVNGTQLVVEKINLLTTTFLRFDKVKIILQNTKLVESSIYNFYQRVDTRDKIDFTVDLLTPREMIAEMKGRIILFMEGKGHWHPGTKVVLQDLDPMESKLKISIIMHHRLKFHDMDMKMSRRELVVEELINVLTELGMVHSLR